MHTGRAADNLYGSQCSQAGLLAIYMGVSAHRQNCWQSICEPVLTGRAADNLYVSQCSQAGLLAMNINCFDSFNIPSIAKHYRPVARHMTSNTNRHNRLFDYATLSISCLALHKVILSTAGHSNKLHMEMIITSKVCSWLTILWYYNLFHF